MRLLAMVRQLMVGICLVLSSAEILSLDAR